MNPPLTPEAVAITQAATRWQAEGHPAAVVTVTAHRGSVPRETGTRMLVSAGACVGTIGGGQLEREAIEAARQLLAAAARGESTAAVERRVALGPTLGQCCGGAVVLRTALLVQDPPASWQWPASRFRLHLYGAGHVGRAIVRLLATLPCQVRWIDARDGGFPDEALPPHIAAEALADNADEAEVMGAIAEAAPGDWHLVLTHSHALDLAIVHALLARGDAGWLGLIGSRSKRASFERRLRERGHGAAALARIVCPIGLPGLVGKQPEVIALAVVAQLWQQVGVLAPGAAADGDGADGGNGVDAGETAKGAGGAGGAGGAPAPVATRRSAAVAGLPLSRGLELPPRIPI